MANRLTIFFIYSRSKMNQQNVDPLQLLYAVKLGQLFSIWVDKLLMKASLDSLLTSAQELL